MWHLWYSSYVQLELLLNASQQHVDSSPVSNCAPGCVHQHMVLPVCVCVRACVCVCVWCVCVCVCAYACLCVCVHGWMQLCTKA